MRIRRKIYLVSAECPEKQTERFFVGGKPASQQASKSKSKALGIKMLNGLIDALNAHTVEGLLLELVVVVGKRPSWCRWMSENPCDFSLGASESKIQSTILHQFCFFDAPNAGKVNPFRSPPTFWGTHYLEIVWSNFYSGKGVKVYLVSVNIRKPVRFFVGSYGKSKSALKKTVTFFSLPQCA